MKKSYRESMLRVGVSVGILAVVLAFINIMNKAEASGHSFSNENAFTDWELGWANTNGQDHFSQYSGQENWDYFQVPAEFAYDTNWNATFGSGGGSGTCASAIGNNVTTAIEGAGNTLYLNIDQSSVGDQNASCIWNN